MHRRIIMVGLMSSGNVIIRLRVLAAMDARSWGRTELRTETRFLYQGYPGLGAQLASGTELDFCLVIREV